MCSGLGRASGLARPQGTLRYYQVPSGLAEVSCIMSFVTPGWSSLFIQFIARYGRLAIGEIASFVFN